MGANEKREFVREIFSEWQYGGCRRKLCVDGTPRTNKWKAEIPTIASCVKPRVHVTYQQLTWARIFLGNALYIP